jgi:hypothetical protein
VVSHLRLGGSLDIDLRWEPSSSTPARYQGRGALPFRGLLPDGARDWSNLEAWRDRFENLTARVGHLGPLRAQIQRSYSIEAARPLSMSGVEAPAWLSSDRELLDGVATWFVAHMEGWRLDIDAAGSAFGCQLSRRGVTVNLADAGQGGQQVLPVVVQQLLRRRETSWFLDLVEQPELHMHAAGHAPLGDLFVETARQGVGCVLVETHSENLMLRVRRRVAEGRLTPDQVAIYWCDEQPEGHTLLLRIHVDTRGDIDAWPAGVFSEGFEEIKALSRAARIPA